MIKLSASVSAWRVIIPTAFNFSEARLISDVLLYVHSQYPPLEWLYVVLFNGDTSMSADVSLLALLVCLIAWY